MRNYQCNCPDCTTRRSAGLDTRHDEINVTRDDLIRLVVGMQWVTAVTLFDPLFANAFNESDIPDDGPRRRFAALPTATTIVDEWLGVR